MDGEKSLTLAAALASVPEGWRHLVEQAFSTCVATTVPFAILTARERLGVLDLHVGFLKPVSGILRERIGIAFDVTHHMCRESYEICRCCARPGIRWYVNGEHLVICKECRQSKLPNAIPAKDNLARSIR